MATAECQLQDPESRPTSKMARGLADRLPRIRLVVAAAMQYEDDAQQELQRMHASAEEIAGFLRNCGGINHHDLPFANEVVTYLRARLDDIGM